MPHHDDDEHSTLPPLEVSERNMRRADPCGYYRHLGVSSHATAQEIRRAFLTLSQHYHTDKHSSQDSSVQETMSVRFQELQEAYSVLSDERQRVAYDVSGDRGSSLLQLVPIECTSRDEIIHHINYLEQRQKLTYIAKLLSASSMSDLTFSVAKLGRLREVLARGTETVPTEESVNEAATSVPPAAGNPSSGVAEGTAAFAAGDDIGSMRVAEVNVGDQKVLILIPSEEVQAQIRERLSDGKAVAPMPGAGGGLTATAPSELDRLLLAANLLCEAATPLAITLRHSFKHALSPQLEVEFRSEARQQTASGAAAVQLTTVASYKADPIHSYKASTRVAPNGMKIIISRMRMLSDLWSLETKLTCLSGRTFLDRLGVTLRRVLAKGTVLKNTLTCSWSNHGFLQSSLEHVWEAGSHCYMQLYTSYHAVSGSLEFATPVTYGLATKKNASAPPKGMISYSVVWQPFSGTTNCGVEAWYYHSKVQHFGIGFSTLIPYAFSPLDFPLCVIQSPNYAVMNKVSFLYRRSQHEIRIPVWVLVSPLLSRGLLWLGGPIAVYRCALVLYRPYATARAAREYEKVRRANVAEVDLARGKAMMEQRALEPLVLASRAAEDQKGGLIIVNARYGVLNPQFVDNTPLSSPGAEGERSRKPCGAFLSRLAGSWATGVDRLGRWLRRHPTQTPAAQTCAVDAVGEDHIPLTIDVTIALQNLVRDSSLTLAEGTKSDLVGFCDPDPHTPESKQLRVVYAFRNKKHLVIVAEDDALELPQREHLLPSG